MAFRIDIRRSQIFQESTEDFNKHWFSFTQQKFLHNIDTFYYTVSLEKDYNKNPLVDDFLYELSALKEKFKETKEPVALNDKLYVMAGRFDDIYEYRITCPDKYDIFVTSYLPNSSTPRMVVQLRSAALWLDGTKETIEDSYYQLVKVLSSFDLKVQAVYENRIDYCYHTNYCQDMYSFFADKKLQKQLKTNMRNFRKDGLIFDDGFELNYFALGSRNSNNVFIRIYDKTREVIEMAYKGFFIAKWLQEGLISKYDEYVLKYCYKLKNYEKRYEGMLQFYLEYANDELHKKEIRLYLQDTDLNFNEIKALALSLMPQITTITNIEFQTKRKFYSGGDNMIETFDKILKCNKNLERLYRIIDNRKVFLNYLTHYNMRFVDEAGEYLSWWKRLRGLKIKDIIENDSQYLRTYQNNLDKDLMFRRTMRTIATNALYCSKIDSDITDDIVSYITSLNDNDLFERHVNDYKEYKEKKYQTIKNQLNLSEVEDSEENS